MLGYTNCDSGLWRIPLDTRSKSEKNMAISNTTSQNSHWQYHLIDIAEMSASVLNFFLIFFYLFQVVYTTS